MRRFFYSLLLMGGLFGTLTLLTDSCTNRSDSDGKDQFHKTQHEIKISNFEFHSVTKSASQSYLLSSAEDTAYLTLSASVQWPDEIGDNDIRVFQDSILSLAFPNDKHKGDIDESIIGFIEDVDIMGDSVSFTPIKKIPADEGDERAYNISVSGKLMEVTQSYVTYQVTNSSYTGGAHPNLYSFPFSYDLKSKKILTIDNMFRPGSEEALIQVIKEALGRQYNVPALHLSSAGMFTDNLTLSRSIFILNGVLYFHYNTYDIAPYYMGAINAEVYPYEIEAYLTPLGDSIL